MRVQGLAERGLGRSHRCDVMRDRRGGLYMPVYEFLCQQCGNSFELSLSISDVESKRQGGLQCPGCGSANVVQQVSSFQVKTSKKS